MSAVRDFFAEFDSVQLETWAFKLQPEVRRVAAIKQEMKLWWSMRWRVQVAAASLQRCAADLPSSRRHRHRCPSLKSAPRLDSRERGALMGTTRLYRCLGRFPRPLYGGVSKKAGGRSAGFGGERNRKRGDPICRRSADPQPPAAAHQPARAPHISLDDARRNPPFLLRLRR